MTPMSKFCYYLPVSTLPASPFQILKPPLSLSLQSKLAGSSNSGGSGKKQLYTDIISIKGKKYYLQDPC